MTNLSDDSRGNGRKEVLPVPNLVKIQVDSYQWFLKEGLKELFDSFSPIEDFTGNLSLNFLDYSLGEPKYSVQECRERDVTYEAPLRVRVQIVDKVGNREIKESEVYLGELPLMTERGTFIINGAERVVVSQLSRSPGVYFRDTIDLGGRTLYSAQIIPSDGAWVEFDIGSNHVIYVRIGQTRKFPVTTLLRAFEFFEEADPEGQEPEEIQLPPPEGGEPQDRRAEIRRLLVGRTLAQRVVNVDTGEVLGEANMLIDEALADRIADAESVSPVLVVQRRDPCATTEEILRLFGREVVLGRYPLYAAEVRHRNKVLHRPGERVLPEHVEELENWRIPRVALVVEGEEVEWSRRQLAQHMRTVAFTADNLEGKRSLAAVQVPGEAAPLVEPFTLITRPVAEKLVQLGLTEFRVWIVDETIEATLAEDRGSGVHQQREAVEEAVLRAIYAVLRPGDSATPESGRSLLKSIFFDRRRYSLARVGRFKINKKLGLHLPLEVQTLTKPDLIAIIRYLIALRNNEEGAAVDDIDHLENKRVRAVGELLQNQLRIGFLRMERVARERMTSLDAESGTAQNILSIKPVTAAIKSFFGSGALSQFMDQTNALSELAHKRRLSAMGPGGLSRQSAKLEVRDVHRSHYGRICPIMTPEGPNIGLISSLALYARVNEFGFLETPYRRVVDGRVTDEVIYLTADQEARFKIAPANVRIGENGELLEERIFCRHENTFPQVPPEEVELMDVSPKQIFSATTSLIPFLENDDANRALMGSNMQRQAVPLVRTEAPLVYTGIESKIAIDSGAVEVAGRDGVVRAVDARHIVIEGYDGEIERHDLLTFVRTNQGTYIHQKPRVQVGQHVRQGDVLADGSCTDGGELALGRNVLVAFMPWEGYNYEDAVILSERMVREDVFTSIHIDRYELPARETKLGPEEITGDIPNVGEDMLRNLDERGIIRIGVTVRPEDILVGKVAPKGQSEMTAEEKLVIAIFGKKAEEMRDTSLRVPHGAKGKVIDVRVFSRYKYVCQKCQTRYDFARSSDLRECEKCGGELVREQGDDLPPGINQLVRVYVAQRRKIMEGDKMAGRHGNKGVISKILPLEDMPYLPDGRPVDIVLNPLGVPSRMNIGQILETHLGWVARCQGRRFKTPVFEGLPEREIMAGLREVTEAQQQSVLRDYLTTEVEVWADDVPPEATTGELLEALRRWLEGLDEAELEAQAEHLAVDAAAWKKADPEGRVELILERIKANALARVGFQPETGKCILYDGRTGEAFRQPVCVGEIYMMKLHHLVDDKIHARSTGPYSLVTQQPLGGKAQFGGQRFGEMEVWSLEAYGAAYSLQEILTIKSDDVLGRVKTYESIVKGENIMEPGIPESFKILIKELQSLGLQVTVKSAEGEPVDLRDADEDR